MTPDFGKSFFEKHQKALVAFTNTRLGRWFFALHKVQFPKESKVYEVRPNSVSYDWKLDHDIDGKLIVKKKTMFFTSNRFENRLTHVYKMASRFIPQALAWKMMQPITGLSGSLAFLPMIALTTSTFYPDANVESTSVDGRILRDGVNETLATIRAGAGTTVEDATAGNYGPYIVSSGTTDQFDTLGRFFALFDTSSIGSGQSVSSATLSISIIIKSSGLGTSVDFDIVSSSPASNTALATTDYGNIGSTVFASIAHTSIATGGYNDFALDANGIANISTTGVSKFGARLSWDTDNSFGGTWAASTFTGFLIYHADEAGTTNDPKLVVEHAVAATGGIVATLLTLGVG